MDKLYYHGISSHPSTIVKKAHQLGINDDRDVLSWKQSIQEYHNKLSGLKHLKACLEDLVYLKNQPTLIDFENTLLKHKGLSSQSDVATEKHDNKFTTLDVNCLQLACLATRPQITLQNICTIISQKYFPKMKFLTVLIT